MSAGWVAATNRGRALLRRRLGPQGAAQIAASPTWADARRELSKTVYGHDLDTNADRSTARAVAATNAVWQLRVLAGWCPPASGGLARLFAAPFEIRNIEAHLRDQSGRPERQPVAVPPSSPTSAARLVPLGPLGAVSSRLLATTSADELRSMLMHSSWGDPGGTDLPTIAFGLRVSWLRRLARRFPETADFTTASLGVLIAREQFVFERAIADTSARNLDRLLGRSWRRATTIATLADSLPARSAHPLADIDEPSDLWHAEVDLIHQASQLVRGGPSETTFGDRSVARIMAAILLDLLLVDAAIETAGRGAPTAELFDAVA